MKKYALLSCLLCAPLAFADDAKQACDAPTKQAIAQFLHISSSELAQRELASACKPDPNQSQTMLAAYAVIQKGFTNENYRANPDASPDWQLTVARIANGKVQQSWQQNSAIDASVDVDSDSLKIDTARYQLNEQIRAFGVYFHNAARGPSEPDFWSDDDLVLLYGSGQKLLPVFHYATFAWQAEATPAVQKQCAQCATMAAEKMIIKIDKSQQHHGFNDLLLRAKIRTNVYQFGKIKSIYAAGVQWLREKPLGDDSIRLRFDGKTYQPTEKKWWLE